MGREASGSAPGSKSGAVPRYKQAKTRWKIRRKSPFSARMKTSAPLRPFIEPLESRIAPAIIFAVEVDTNKLVSFDSAAPGTLLTDVAITGLNANEVVAGIDFDQQTGTLYGIGVVDNGATRTVRGLTIVPATGAATQFGTFSLAGVADVDEFGMEFTGGLIRITNSADGNHFISDIAVGSATALSDPAQNETITGLAFSGSAGGGSSTAYAYNFFTDELVTIGDIGGTPQGIGSGVVKPVAHANIGGANVSATSAQLGFDIAALAGGPEQGWLSVFRTSNGTHLYTMDLANAAMTDLGAIGDGTRKFGGLTVQIAAAAPAISTDGKTATWTDLDGDVVTLKITKGTLTAANFAMLAGARGSALSKLTLTDTTFTGTNVTLTAKPGAGGGDGRVNVGAINATGVDLGAVTIAGDLTAIDAGTDTAPAPSVKSLTVASMGAFGAGLLSGGDTFTALADGAGKITIAGDFHTNLSLGKNKTGSVSIGGNVIGGTSAGRGSITNDSSSGSLGKLTVKGSVIALDSNFNAQFSLRSVGSVVIGGDISGGMGGGGGLLNIGGTGKTTVTIGGSVIGGATSNSGVVALANVAQIKIGGSLLGGDGASSGSISVFSGPLSIAIKGSMIGGDGFASGSISAANSGVILKSVTVGGSVVSTGADLRIAAQRIGAVKVGGDISGNDGGRVVIAARGTPAPASTAESIAIGSVTAGGDVKNALIVAGIEENLIDITADAAIGAIKIGRSLIASSITAGIDPVNGVFGDADDKFVGGNNGNAAIIAKIASITIGGQIVGTSGGATDSFGIEAEQIGKITIGKVKVPLTTGKDDLTLGFTSDVRVREL